MALPIDPSEGYMRVLPYYKHDVFAHDGSDGCTRVRPHSGVDATPTVPNARNRAVLSGTVTRTGFSIYTGNYVEIRDAKGRYWLTFHQRQNLVKAGDIVSAGAVIGYTGNTGGTGALGSAKIGVHNHTSLCATQAASTGLIAGLVRARYKNETPEAWAKAHGLLDPWPVIQESLKDSDKDDNPVETPRKYRFTDMFIAEATDSKRVYLVTTKSVLYIPSTAALQGFTDAIKLAGGSGERFKTTEATLIRMAEVLEGKHGGTVGV